MIIINCVSNTRSSDKRKEFFILTKNNKNIYRTMKETCEITGLSYDTLKFYSNEGLIPDVKRNKNNHRIFDENNIRWIRGLKCLRECGLSISEMKKYVDLGLSKETIPEKLAILQSKITILEEEIKRARASIQYIHMKEKYYAELLEGKDVDFENIE